MHFGKKSNAWKIVLYLIKTAESYCQPQFMQTHHSNAITIISNENLWRQPQ